MIVFIFGLIMHAALMILLMGVTELHWFWCFLISGLTVWAGIVVVAIESD